MFFKTVKIWNYLNVHEWGKVMGDTQHLYINSKEDAITNKQLQMHMKKT